MVLLFPSFDAQIVDQRLDVLRVGSSASIAIVQGTIDDLVMVVACVEEMKKCLSAFAVGGVAQIFRIGL
jgi:hypothetical protein